MARVAALTLLRDHMNDTVYRFISQTFQPTWRVKKFSRHCRATPKVAVVLGKVQSAYVNRAQQTGQWASDAFCDPFLHQQVGPYIVYAPDPVYPCRCRGYQIRTENEYHDLINRPKRRGFAIMRLILVLGIFTVQICSIDEFEKRHLRGMEFIPL